jgi:hypothetical protein
VSAHEPRAAAEARQLVSTQYRTRTPHPALAFRFICQGHNGAPERFNGACRGCGGRDGGCGRRTCACLLSLVLLSLVSNGASLPTAHTARGRHARLAHTTGTRLAGVGRGGNRHLSKSFSSDCEASCSMRASRAAAHRLWAAVMAWMSPVRCRLNSSIGITCPGSRHSSTRPFSPDPCAHSKAHRRACSYTPLQASYTPLTRPYTPLTRPRPRRRLVTLTYPSLE